MPPQGFGVSINYIYVEIGDKTSPQAAQAVMSHYNVSFHFLLFITKVSLTRLPHIDYWLGYGEFVAQWIHLRTHHYRSLVCAQINSFVGKEYMSYTYNWIQQGPDMERQLFR
jgi:hypothetical protein